MTELFFALGRIRWGLPRMFATFCASAIGVLQEILCAILCGSTAETLPASLRRLQQLAGHELLPVPGMCLLVPASPCALGYTSILMAILSAAIGITTGHLLAVSLLPVLDLVAGSCQEIFSQHLSQVQLSLGW